MTGNTEAQKVHGMAWSELVMFTFIACHIAQSKWTLECARFSAPLLFRDPLRRMVFDLVSILTNVVQMIAGV